MKIASVLGVLATALLVGCSTTQQATSPGAVEDVNGTTFVCSASSCRVVADGGSDAQINQGVIYNWTLTKSGCKKRASTVCCGQCPDAAEKAAQGDQETVGPGAVGGTKACPPCPACPAACRKSN